MTRVKTPYQLMNPGCSVYVFVFFILGFHNLYLGKLGISILDPRVVSMPFIPCLKESSVTVMSHDRYYFPSQRTVMHNQYSNDASKRIFKMQ